MLVSYEPGVKTTHKKNPNWWGLKEGKFEGNSETLLLTASYAGAKSPDLALWFDRVDARLLDEVRAFPGVAAADARRITSTRVEGPGGGWIPTRLLVVRDFADQRTGLVHQHEGAWPAQGGILIEQSSLPRF